MMVKSFNELIDKNRISIEYIENINWMKLSKEELSFYIINNFGKISLLADSLTRPEEDCRLPFFIFGQVSPRF
jgi:hypothetical protein